MATDHGIVTSPHFLASETGAHILREGGTAVEAMVAMAATIAVVYPHMNSIGGDGFWLIKEKGKPIKAIEACGPAAQNATPQFYDGHTQIPNRGPLAALTMAGAVSGWQKALALSDNNIPLAELMAPAIDHAHKGIKTTKSQTEAITEKWDGLSVVSGYQENYAPCGLEHVAEGALFTQPHLAATLSQLVSSGLDDFYRGDLARSLAKSLSVAGSPLELADFEGFHARNVAPLHVKLSCGDVYNMPPPTQGVSTLMILGIFDQLGDVLPESFAHHHHLIEAVKQAFILRNAHVTDPEHMAQNAQEWLTPEFIAGLVAQINTDTAMPWPHTPKPGDTVWMGCIDKDGTAVSYIQSIYWEFGSGFVAGETGIVWQNRGTSFTLGDTGPNNLLPGKRPFHTLNPSLATLHDGSVVSFGTMGGEGQPQTQAQIFTRAAMKGQSWQDAISAPRWLLGRTWGDDSTSLKLENRFDPALIEKLTRAGHEVELMADYTSVMGHAGAVQLSTSGVYEGGADPRSDGAVI